MALPPPSNGTLYTSSPGLSCVLPRFTIHIINTSIRPHGLIIPPPPPPNLPSPTLSHLHPRRSPHPLQGSVVVHSLLRDRLSCL